MEKGESYVGTYVLHSHVNAWTHESHFQSLRPPKSKVVVDYIIIPTIASYADLHPPTGHSLQPHLATSNSLKFQDIPNNDICAN